MKLTVILPAELKEKNKMYLFLTKVVGLAVTVATIIGGWALVGSSVMLKLHDAPHAVRGLITVIIIAMAVFNILWVGSLVMKDVKESYGK